VNPITTVAPTATPTGSPASGVLAAVTTPATGSGATLGLSSTVGLLLMVMGGTLLAVRRVVFRRF
jgi:hypothetical protein